MGAAAVFAHEQLPQSIQDDLSLRPTPEVRGMGLKVQTSNHIWLTGNQPLALGLKVPPGMQQKTPLLLSSQEIPRFLGALCQKWEKDQIHIS